MAEAAAGAPEQGAGAAAAAPEAAAAAPPLILRFLFANERARLEMEVPETCSVPELKARLLAAWPEGLERTPTRACAGRPARCRRSSKHRRHHPLPACCRRATPLACTQR